VTAAVGGERQQSVMVATVGDSGGWGEQRQLAVAAIKKNKKKFKRNYIL